MALHPTDARKDLKHVIFTVLQKNTWSMNSSQRIEELFQEVQVRKWDVILVSETWRSNEEVWESNQGHIEMESGKFTNKRGVAIILHRRWRQKVNWVECVSDDIIRRVIEKDKDVHIIGGDFNAELGPGIGVEQASVGHYTLKDANCRGEWMTQWLLEQRLLALNTMYRETTGLHP